MKIIAHRGDSASHPENTPEGWAAAFRNGAFAIEADVRLSSDGACICAHDPDLMRLFNRPERPEDLTAGDLLGLASTSGARIVALGDVLQHAGDNRHVLLDIKDETQPALEAIWATIIAAVPQDQRHLLIAGCHTLQAVAFFAGKAETGILGFVPDQDQAEAFFEAGAKIIRLWERDASAERIRQLQQLGVEVWITTGGSGTSFRGGQTSPDHLARLIEAGAEGVLVDDVSMVKAVVETAP